MVVYRSTYVDAAESRTALLKGPVNTPMNNVRVLLSSLMKRLSLSRVCLLVVAVLSFASISAVQSQSSQNDKPSNDDILHGILRRDKQAIENAGNSGDQRYVVPLQQALQSHIKEEASTAAMVALAKLGDSFEQQHLWCTSSFSAFESIGGWYGVRASEYFLLPGAQKRWKKQRQKWQHSDVPPPPSPAFWALVALSKIVPSAPDEIRFDRNGGIGSNFDMGLQHTRDAQEHYTELEPFIVQWEEWIAAHREELRKLKPTGDDVNFSPSGCKNRTRVAGAATAR